METAIAQQIYDNVEDFKESYGCDLHFDMFENVEFSDEVMDYFMEYIKEKCKIVIKVEGKEYNVPLNALKVKEIVTSLTMDIANDIIKKVTDTAKFFSKIDLWNNRLEENVGLFKEILSNIYKRD